MAPRACVRGYARIVLVLVLVPPAPNLYIHTYIHHIHTTYYVIYTQSCNTLHSTISQIISRNKCYINKKCVNKNQNIVLSCHSIQ